MWFYFIGFLPVFLDFYITLPHSGSLNALPDFLGYALLILAAFLSEHENEHFRRQRAVCFVALPLSLAEFILEVTAVKLPDAVTLSVSILMTALALYIAYEFSEGAKALERTRYQKLTAEKLASAWLILGMSSLLRILAFFFTPIALTCEFLHLFAVIWFAAATFGFVRRAKG